MSTKTVKMPRPYHLEQCPTPTGQNQCALNLAVFEYEDHKGIVICTNYDIFLKPQSARVIAKRLLAMADWAEDGPK